MEKILAKLAHLLKSSAKESILCIALISPTALHTLIQVKINSVVATPNIGKMMYRKQFLDKDDPKRNVTLIDRKRMLNLGDYGDRSQTAKANATSSKKRRMNESKSNEIDEFKKAKPKSFYNLLMENGYISNPADINSTAIFHKGKRRGNSDWNRLKIDKMALDDFD